MSSAEERIKMVKAMEFIARHLNDERDLDRWLLAGVADGDIQYGDLSVSTPNDEATYYAEDPEVFSELMHTFLLCMGCNPKNAAGMLQCGGVASGGHYEQYVPSEQLHNINEF